ncbi:translocation and assembly module TamB [Pelomonas saccharophila]|uniref:Translocation and assembly module TamB n=1 Tax=Roseateles saccharophilus TaxID=304 RepID=A0ABU1YL17_ROSSA|nr:translocation/assembly module TamB domain-containing protein [Roseateles saccharophilus]MDR7268691.1 translocation and assembly module TamB [Roseateles saccharophilus]
MRRSLRVLRALLIALALVLLLVAGFIAWLLHRPAGGAWLMAHLPGVQIEAPEGSLMGEFSARRLIITWTGGSAELRGLHWKGLGLTASDGLLLAQELVVDEVVIRSQASDKPIALPPDLTLPLGVHIASLRVAKLSWAPDQAPLLGLDGQLNLPRRGTHHIQLKAARWQHLTLAGEAKIASAAPLQTDATLRVQQTEATDLPWTAIAAVTGPLAKLKAKAELEAAHQTLKADGEVQPFAPWPVNALQLKADKLDLAALAPGLPRTALSGEAQLKAPARDAEATLQADLSNASAGRWDQGALPVRRLVIALAGRPDQLASLRLTALDAELPGGGRVQGKGQREADGRWQLEARVQGLRPEALDARATPARLDGPLTLAGSKGGPLNVRLDLSGTIENRPLRLKAQLQGEGTKWRIEDARLASGDATLQASGRVDTAGAAQFKAQLRQFDPHLLWRGAPGTAWARLPGPTRINAEADVDVRGKGLATLSGTAYVRLLPGQFAGLPLEGRVKLQRERTADAAAFDIDGRLGNNRVQTSGQARPEAVTGTASLKAASLAELNPLLALFEQQPIAGQGEAEGSYQLVRGAKGWQAGGSGRLSLASAKALGTSIASLKARWELPLPGADGDGPVALNLDIGQLRDPLAQLSSARIDLQGRRSAHDVKAAVSGKITREAQDLALNARVQARGRWDGQAWSGRVARIDIGPLRPNTPPLLAAQDISLRWSSDGPRLQAEPGRAEVGGAFIRWQTLSWTGGEHPEARAELQLEDVAAAPLMARWQPDFGWGGDLRVTGHASLLLNDRLTAELLIERQSGDLRVTDEFGQRALGLTDLRLAVNVKDGIWQFAQGIAGSELGSLGGALTLRPAGLWPDAQTPVQGVLQANVANLATWGSWVPAGWRLGGRAAATVQLSGRLGSPDLTGRAEGENLALRHLLFGVDVTEGRFTLDFKGQHAELSKLEARGGDGWLRASGKAELGAEPKAHIEMTADKLRVLSRVDRRLVASGQATLDLDAKGLKLDGKLRADEGLFDFSRGDAPALADDVTVLRGQRDAAPTAPPAPKAARNSIVNVAIDFGRDFKVRGRGLATTLRGQLQVSQNNGPLRVTGKLDADSGQYAAYGQKLDIERGDISFTGAYDNPSLDLLAVRPNLDVRVGVYVGGTALAPRVSLYSSPEMSDTDKLSWLLLGRGPDGLGRTDTALLQRAALALLSGEGEGPTGKVLRNLGLDELSLSQSDDDTKATIVRLGKQISRRWYVGYERGLNATTGSWQLIYRIAQRFTLRAQGGEDNALDLIWQWKWD